MNPIHFAYDNRIIWRTIIISALLVAGAVSVVLIEKDPSFPQWLYYVVVLAIPIYAFKLIRAVLKIVQPAPAITISDSGIRDASWGRTTVPWQAILRIKETRVSRKLGGVIFFLDAEKMDWMPGPIQLKLANWIRGVRAGQPGEQIVLMLTPSAALQVSFDELINAIKRQASIAGVPFEGESTI
ncbi:protein of unknown function [Candidatus Filomicrobium marinum]|uniref:Uncharacterized protein n=2 Tax=Filomicrobium TaxID=119044 RepID=A0A0D6JHP9_9HYPH|nr:MULTISPECIES: hypothetical protein [Filomicrobium]MCV0369642.1 hypothetical protein [Filomicrobium sp.]CFX46919.1 protein of unknown function [Candidatus Filomicrobium marinum]CPR20596.1 protein of unknown function [Candidatus Filomicrobium marinum]SDP16396.1 hypothetical protein SAMN04488061_2367 [Filomicrobium insigne]